MKGCRFDHEGLVLSREGTRVFGFRVRLGELQIIHAFASDSDRMVRVDLDTASLAFRINVRTDRSVRAARWDRVVIDAFENPA